MRAPRTHALLLAVMGLAAVARSEPIEPPPEAAAGADYVAEPADSLETGSLAWSYGVSGAAGRAVARRRSMRFQGDSVEAAVREGDDEPYGGGDVSARGARRSLHIGRIAPRWGLGLVVGSPALPWRAGEGRAADVAAARSRSGEGISCAWSSLGLEAMGGRFGRRALGGLAWRRGWAGLGALADRGGAIQGSLALESPAAAAECALDRSGRWRAEGAARGSLGPTSLVLRARVGHEAYRSLAEPARAGPARVAWALLAGGPEGLRVRLAVAAWRFAPGASGARAALEGRGTFAEGGTLSAGFEEQHGVRREPATAWPRPRGMRQGAWIEWRGGPPALALAVRHEVWGARPFARAGVRRSLGAAVEARLVAGVRLEAAHTVYRVRSGETLYLPERDTDRWVLRALNGAGERSRLSLRIPTAEGTLQAGLGLGRSAGRSRAQWSLLWSRRLRLRRAR